MSPSQTPPRVPALVLAAACFAACGTPGRNVPVEVPAGPALSRPDLVAAEAGRLLSADPTVSREAEHRLLLLDEPGRRALATVKADLGDERDPRWLNVLDENQMLPPLSSEQRLEFLLWKAAREDRFLAAKAQSGLADLARSHPDLLIRRLEALPREAVSPRTARDAESLGIALAIADVRAAVPGLVDFYLAARDVAERRAAAEALALLVGEERRPRVTGGPADLKRDADAIRHWWAASGQAVGAPGGTRGSGGRRG